MRILPRTALLLLALGGVVTACAPDKPWIMEQSSITPNKIALVEGRHIIKKPLAALSDADIANAASAYRRTGAGPVYVVVAHDATGKTGTDAPAQAAGIAARLQGRGLAAGDIVASAVPLQTTGTVALIAFDTLEARGPEGCTAVPGLESLPGQESDFDYRLGCGVKTMMAKQIADPRDLEGRAGLGGMADGERAASVVSGYRNAAEPREFLPSYVISELAGSGQ